MAFYTYLARLHLYCSCTPGANCEVGRGGAKKYENQQREQEEALGVRPLPPLIEYVLF